MIKRYQWGFKGLRGVAVSVEAKDEFTPAKVVIRSGNPRNHAIVMGFLDSALSPYGHPLKGSANALDLEGVLRGKSPYGLGGYQPYPTHTHSIRPYPDLPEGSVS